MSRLSLLSLRTLLFSSLETVASSLQSLSLVGYGDVSEKVDCKTTHWKHEPCNATCGEGFSWKYRSIIVRFYDGEGNKSWFPNIFSNKLTASSAERRSSVSKNNGAPRALLQRLRKLYIQSTLGTGNSLALPASSPSSPTVPLLRVECLVSLFKELRRFRRSNSNADCP